MLLLLLLFKIEENSKQHDLTVHNTENVLGAYYAKAFTMRCAMTYSDKQQPPHPEMSPRLPSTLSNYSSHFIRHNYLQDMQATRPLGHYIIRSDTAHRLTDNSSLEVY